MAVIKCALRNSGRFPEIYVLNKEEILKNDGNLAPGMPLALPPLDMESDEYLAFRESIGEITNVRNSDSRGSSSSDPSKYYYNTGHKCPREATYAKLDLLSKVKKGDVIFEANGSFGIAGHIAIVEGIFKDVGRKYIRLIEAIDKGVKRGILNDYRYRRQDARVLRVGFADDEQIENAIKFCKKQLNKWYIMDAGKNTSENERNWYCSELVWAA